MHTFRWKGFINGLPYHKYDSVKHSIEEGSTVTLRPVNNSVDRNAVGVFFAGLQIGWIPRYEKKWLPDFFKISKMYELYGIVTCHNVQVSQSRRLEIEVVVKTEEDVARQILAGTETYEVPETKEQQMNKTIIAELIESNKNAATSAAYMEAGRIANKEVSHLLAKQLPLVVRGYADTSAGRLVVANLAALVVQQFRPGEKALVNLAQAMQVQAYQELIQTLDIEGFVENLLNNPKIKTAIEKLTPNNKE